MFRTTDFSPPFRPASTTPSLLQFILSFFLSTIRSYYQIPLTLTNLVSRYPVGNMLLKRLMLAVAGLAVATQAFLVPPEVSESEVKAANALPVEAYVVPDHQLLNLTCPGCPLVFRGKHGFAKIKTDRASHLELAFAVDHELDHDRLFVNNFEIYPSSDPFRSALGASLVPDDVGRRHMKHRKTHKSSPPSRLGFSLQVHPVAENKEQGLQLISLDLQIIEVGSMFVDGIPNVHVGLVKDSNGRLAIGSIGTTESQTLGSTPGGNQGECTTLLCKWVTIMKDKLSHMKSGKNCAGMKSGAAEGSQHGYHGHHNHHDNQNNHGARPDGTEYRHHRHSWGLLFKSIAAHILLPVAVGIIAGVTVSL